MTVVTGAAVRPPRIALAARTAIAVAVLGTVFTGCTVIEEAPEPTPAGPPPIIRFERDGYRLTYHVPSAFVSLFELEGDPQCLRNLAPQMPERVAQLRRALEIELGVESLDDLQDNFAEHIEHLKKLGYL